MRIESKSGNSDQPCYNEQSCKKGVEIQPVLITHYHNKANYSANSQGVKAGFDLYIEEQISEAQCKGNSEKRKRQQISYLGAKHCSADKK